MAENKRDTYIKPIPDIENIAYYKTTRDGKLYFCCGKTRIEVVEHFANHGKTLGVLVGMSSPMPQVRMPKIYG